MLDSHVQQQWSGAGSMANSAASMVEDAGRAWRDAGHEQTRPCVLYRPRIYIDGNKWCALYGDNIQDGVAGFGDSPELAMRDFDASWAKVIPHKESPHA